MGIDGGIYRPSPDELAIHKLWVQQWGFRKFVGSGRCISSLAIYLQQRKRPTEDNLIQILTIEEFKYIRQNYISSIFSYSGALRGCLSTTVVAYIAIAVMLTSAGIGFPSSPIVESSLK